MKKLLLLLMTTLLFTACATRPTAMTDWNEPLIQQAIQMVRNNEADCVLVTGGRLIPSTTRRGVSPLLELFDEHGKDFRGGIIVDKVIGRAAASIAICGGAVAVHGELMSEDGEAFLQANGLATSAKTRVPRILNRKMDGLCPLEQSVAAYQEPTQALSALRETVRRLAVGQPAPVPAN